MSDNNRIGSHCFYRRCVNLDAPYRERVYKWFPGVLRYWGTDHIDCEDGPAHYPCAVVEDTHSKDVHVVHASDISFNSIPPDMRES
jgi:hypothetical protein